MKQLLPYPHTSRKGWVGALLPYGSHRRRSIAGSDAQVLSAVLDRSVSSRNRPENPIAREFWVKKPHYMSDHSNVFCNCSSLTQVRRLSPPDIPQTHRKSRSQNQAPLLTDAYSLSVSGLLSHKRTTCLTLMRPHDLPLYWFAAHLLCICKTPDLYPNPNSNLARKHWQSYPISIIRCRLLDSSKLTCAQIWAWIIWVHGSPVLTRIQWQTNKSRSWRNTRFSFSSPFLDIILLFLRELCLEISPGIFIEQPNISSLAAAGRWTGCRKPWSLYKIHHLLQPS